MVRRAWKRGLVLVSAACGLLFGCSLLLDGEPLGSGERADAATDGEVPADTSASGDTTVIDAFVADTLAADALAADTAAADATVADTADARPSSMLPPEGVYTYAITPHPAPTIMGCAKAKDDLNSGVCGAACSLYYWGAVTTAQVRRLDADCVSLALDLRDRYVETTHLCERKGATSADDSLVRFLSNRHQWLDLKPFLTAGYVDSTLECAKPDAGIGGDDMEYRAARPVKFSVKHACDGRNGAVGDKGPSTFVTGGDYTYEGEQDLVVGGAKVRTRHYSDRRKVVGTGFDGEDRADWYFAVENRVLVRLDRQIYMTTYGLPYAECGSLTLLSMTPAPLPASDAGASDATTDAPIAAKADGTTDAAKADGTTEAATDAATDAKADTVADTRSDVSPG